MNTVIYSIVQDAAILTRDWSELGSYLPLYLLIYVTCVIDLYSFRGLDSLSGKSKSPGPVSLPLEGVILSLQDLIFYFHPPEEELEHEEKQTKLRSLRNRQNLFQEEVIRTLHLHVSLHFRIYSLCLS